MQSVAYRLATATDVEALVRLRVAMQAEVSHGNPSALPQLQQALNDYFTKAIPTGEFLAYLAESAGNIVAASGMVFHRHPPSLSSLGGIEAYIMNMYTLPEHRGRGIATELLHRLLDLAEHHGCLRVVLYAVPKGRSIYEKAGFVGEPAIMRLDQNARNRERRGN